MHAKIVQKKVFDCNMCPCLCLASTEINIFFRPLGQTLLRTLGNRVHIAQNECLVLGVQIFFSAQSCPTLCDPVDYSPPGFSVNGISQVRILEWVARLSFSNESVSDQIRSAQLLSRVQLFATP